MRRRFSVSASSVRDGGRHHGVGIEETGPAGVVDRGLDRFFPVHILRHDQDGAAAPVDAHLLGDFQDGIVAEEIEQGDLGLLGLGGNLRHDGVEKTPGIDKNRPVGGEGGDGPAAVHDEDPARPENLDHRSDLMAVS